jgi:hypothetical protein
MKKILTILAILVCSFSFSQRERILSTEFYKDVNSRLVNEKIIIFDSINKQELMNRFENWAGTNFRNYSEVRTSKTDNQITLLYVSNSMYIIMNVEFKDYKIRLSFYDDGNVYIPSSYSGNIYIPGVAARSRHMINYFDSDGVLEYKPGNGMLNIKGRTASMIISYKTDIEKSIIDIENTIKQKSIIKKSDW